MLVYIVRHGETEWNKLKRLQGRCDIPLNEKGRELARAAGKKLQEIPFCRVYTSPLCRARETAELMLEGRDVPMETEMRVQELGFGSWEGCSTLNPDYPEPGESFQYFFSAPEKYVPAPDGETFEELVERTGEFLGDLASKGYRREDILMVSTHGAASRALLANICGNEIRNFWMDACPPNCAVSIAEYDGEGWKLLKKDWEPGIENQ